jgi:acetoin utilization deacetylase AcuC-like enzyme
MTTLMFSHPACLEHFPGPHHPESPDRLRAVIAALDAPEFADLVRREAPAAERDQLERAHGAAYIDTVFASVPSTGRIHLDPDTALSPGSGEAALRAAGAVCAAVDAVVAGEARNAFCAVRPPGHHAEPGRAMGFCLFNNVVVGALHARAAHGLARVAVIDFDVHHGNGSQAMIENDPDLFYASTHQWPYYPGTGASGERGVGNVVNVPLAAGAGSAEFRHAMDSEVLPALRAFGADFVLISAGFDAHAADPLAGLRFTDGDFAWATAEIARIAAECCDGRLASTLEGGYDFKALGTSCAAHVGALMGD